MHVIFKNSQQNKKRKFSNITTKSSKDATDYKAYPKIQLNIMLIKYLQLLKDNPIKYANDTKFKFEIRGISESEIQQLELTWNNGNLFPKVLKELLFLAGNFCYVCDYGPNDSQQEMQEWIREHLEDSNRSINRPFYAFDIWGGLNFLFIYLDQGDNPNIFQASPYCDDDNWIKPLIQSIIEIGINRVKIGQNPY